MRWNDIGEMTCSVARALSVVGDRWTLLVLRDAFLGLRRFEDFQRDLGTTRHRLAERGPRGLHGPARSHPQSATASEARAGKRAPQAPFPQAAAVSLDDRATYPIARAADRLRRSATQSGLRRQ